MKSSLNANNRAGHFSNRVASADLGTEVHHYEDNTINARLGIEDDFRENQTAPIPRPSVNADAREFISRWFKWDLDCGYTF